VYSKVVRPWKEPSWSPGELDEPGPVAHSKDLPSIHGDTVADFLTAPGKLEAPARRSNVAFQLQGIQLQPPAGGLRRRQSNWEVKSVDLVGLVLHPEPVVYVSETVPNMKRLKAIPKRPPDVFELAGLDALQRGEGLFVRSRDGVVRALGPIRAGKSCLECHGGKKEGDLLGALSYTLRQVEFRLGFGPPAQGGQQIGFPR
jgi:hypothetical protein